MWRTRYCKFWIIASSALLFSCSSGNDYSPLMKSDAIVLLAGDFKERAPAAAALFKGGYADKIILTNDGVFSSWSTKYNRNLYQIEWAEEELVKLGIPRERIVRLPFYGSSTVYDALALRGYAIGNGLKNVILVTSDYHARRALWTFKKVFLNVTQVEFAVYPAKSLTASTKTCIVEYCKLVFYQVRYGLLGLMPAI